MPHTRQAADDDASTRCIGGSGVKRGSRKIIQRLDNETKLCREVRQMAFPSDICEYNKSPHYTFVRVRSV